MNARGAWVCLGAAGVSALLTGCGIDDRNGLADEINRSVVPNGVQLNGVQLNGVQLNGVQLNGVQLNGVQLNGVQLNGVQLNGVQLNGSLLSGLRNGDSTQTVAGPQLAGAVFNLTVKERGVVIPYVLRIDSIELDSMVPAGDVYLYWMSFRRADDTTWRSLCQDGSGNPAAAIPLTGLWDLRTGARIPGSEAVTFACTSAAIGKCVRWGYRPWATATQCYGGQCATVSLADHHQACTRMVRADYCGNGTAHTVNGTPIDIFDSLSPSIQTRTTSWQVEAKWTPSGATCLGKTRASALLDEMRYPSCRDASGRKIQFAKCDNSDYTLAAPNLLGSSFDSL